MARIGYRGRTGPAWLRRCVIKLELAWEHIGWGFYKDRRFPMIRIFPVPFVKITLGLLNGPSAQEKAKTQPVSTEPKVDETGHIDVECTNPECYGCMFCDGGLWACTICCGLEGSMPSTCPGERMTHEQSDAVYRGNLDYRDGAWVEGTASRFSPKGWREDAK